MGTIAAEAGVGIGTLYRRYPNREALLEALTLRAFRLVLRCAEDAETLNEPGLATLSSFLDCVISHADQLVLPLHGGPVPTAAETLAIRSRVHQALQRILDRGRARRHDPRGRHRARHHRLGRAAGTAAAERRRPGPGTQAAEGLLPRRPRSPPPADRALRGGESTVPFGMKIVISPNGSRVSRRLRRQCQRPACEARRCRRHRGPDPPGRTARPPLLPFRCPWRGPPLGGLAGS